MKIINLTDEQYNNLMNSNSLEEIKSLLSQNNANSNNIVDENLISIRVLSKNEYNKFIVNSTLDGAIVQFDVDSWHYSKCCSALETIFVMTDWYNNSSSLVNPYIPADLLKLNRISIYGQGEFRNYKTYNFGNKNGEIVNDNKSSVCNILPNYSAYVVLYGQSQYTGITCKYFLVDDNNLLIDKNITNKNFTLSSNIIYYHRNNEASVQLDILCDLFVCFRPVFQYKDNVKSENIFS